MTRYLRFPLLLAVLLLTSYPASAQVTTGTPPFSSSGGGPDIIDLANLNSHITIPVIHKAGRGTDFSYNLNYDSSLWYPLGGQYWTAISNLGWTGQTAAPFGSIYYKHLQVRCRDPESGQWYYQQNYYGFTYTDELGITHSFPLNVDDQECGGSPYSASAVATDGSGYTMYASADPSVYVVSPSGSKITPDSATVFTDRNGNQMSASSGVMTDTLGTSALNITGAAPNPVTLTYTAPNGSAHYTINYATYTVKTNFACPGVAESGPTAIPLVSSVTLADGSSYTFTYEDTPGYAGDKTGRIASVTLPTGGRITYTYSGGNGGINCSDGSTATLTRQTPDGTWTYAQTKDGGAASHTDITDPQGNQTRVYFQGIYETKRQVYQGAIGPTPLETVDTCYNGAASPCTGTAVVLPITQRAVITTLGSAQSKHVDFFSTYGLLTESDDYDFPSGTSLLKKTTISYASLGNGIVSQPSQVIVYDGGSNVVSKTTYAYDETGVVGTSGTPQHAVVSGSRGNLTSINAYTSASSYLTTRMTYFDTGNVQTITDVNGAQTTFGYGACGNSFPTSVTEPLSMSRSMTWDANCYGAVMTSLTDENGQPTTVTYNDPYFWRPASEGFPDGGQTSWTYDNPNSVTTTVKMNASQNITGKTLLDGLGRTHQTQLTSDPEGVDYTDTSYDSLGRVGSVSNPYRSTSDPTYGITSSQYDALGRVTATTLQDGSVSHASYTDNTVTATDPAGKAKKSVFDGLGRAVQVFEDPSGLNYETDYTHDPLGNLTHVDQKGGSPNSGDWRTRQFAYDFLSRMTQEITPEGGTINYTYDTGSHGDLYTRVAPAPNQTGGATVTTTYSWDALHRLTHKSYSDGTTAAPYFSYDLSSPWGSPYGGSYMGRLSETEIYDGSGNLAASRIYVYDPMGRIQETGECVIAVNCSTGLPGFHTVYAHDLAGNLTSYNTVESGITFGYQYDGAARPTSITNSIADSQHPSPLATVDSSVGYSPTSALQQMAYGSGMLESRTYNSRLQPVEFKVYTPGNFLRYDFSYGYSNGSNNGNVMSWNASGWDFTFNRAYTYDALNRLSTFNQSSGLATSCSSSFSLSWNYDPWGNRTDQNVTGGTCNSFHATVDTKNRLTTSPYQYDAAGNLTYDGSHSYTYDAEGRLTAVDGGSTAAYVYDAEGNRVKKTVGSVVTVYALNPDGQVIHETDANLNFNAHYIYLGGQLIAEMKNGTTYFAHTDHLGSIRLLTKIDQSGYDYFDNLPFGELIGGATGTTHKFTGLERDSETNLDHTWFRQYSSQFGRWTTADPAGLMAVSLDTPQSLNRYSYVSNMPLSYFDPTGLCGDGLSDISHAECDGGTGGQGGGMGGAGGGGAPFPQCAFVTSGLMLPNQSSAGTLTCFWNWDPSAAQGANSPQRLNVDRGGGIDWAWWKGLALSPLQWRFPSIGTDSCYAVFLDTVTGGGAADQAKSVAGLADKLKQYGPLLTNAASVGMFDAAAGMRSMLRAKTLDPTLGPLAISALSYGSSIVSQVGPYAVRAGATGVWGAIDYILGAGVWAEGKAAWKGQCKP